LSVAKTGTMKDERNEFLGPPFESKKGFDKTKYKKLIETPRLEEILQLKFESGDKDSEVRNSIISSVNAIAWEVGFWVTSGGMERRTQDNSQVVRVFCR
jgi:hypothetical protein